MQSEFERLQVGIDPITPLFVLVDPMVGDPLPGAEEPAVGSDGKAQREQLWGREVTPIILARTTALPLHQHPYLVHLHGPADPLLALTFTLADEERLAAQAGGLDGEGRAVHRIGGWLQSGMRAEEVAQLLSNMCRVSTQMPVAATYLRLADRRVLDLLCHVVGEDRVVAPFGRLQSWRYLDATGEIRALQASCEHGDKLVLSANEWQQMTRGSMLHRAMARYVGEKASAQASLKHAGYVAIGNALSSAADAKLQWPHRFQHEDDEGTWAVLSMLWPSIAQIASVKKLLAEVDLSDEPPDVIRYLWRDLMTLCEQASLSPN